MAASTIAPTAMAMPPSDITFELTPIIRSGMNEMTTAIGIVRIGMTALGGCHRNMSMIIETTISSSIRVDLRF